MTVARPLGTQYVLEAVLGSGATVRVYYGQRRTGDDRVAVKVLHDHWSDDENALPRLVQEKRVLDALDHPGHRQGARPCR